MCHHLRNLILCCFFIGFVLPNSQLFAQDLIIKTNGDSIICKIKQVAPLYLVYIHRNQYKPIKKTIPLKEVKAYLFNVVQQDSLWLAKADKEDNKALSKGFYLSAGYGFGMLNGPQPQNIPPALDDYLNELRSGNAFHLNVGYFPKSLYGIGIHYSSFNTSNESNIAVITSQGNTFVGKLSDDIRIRYLALGVQFKLGQVTDVFSLNSSFGAGYTQYYNDAVFIDSHLITAESFGTHGYIWLEVNLGTHFALTAGGGLFFTKFNEFKIDYYSLGKKFTYTPSEPDNNNRYDLFVGMRYKF